ncbi:NIF3-like protein 1 isoform X3 [Cricetulus griseus]|uniref:NIF3-like protein 1 n=1 Tax=Cricetulus griseus TaxID=10029 RepID=A0A9J7F7V4_CRIGR|nr:NIF3-like protein 1 isoform X3 [Cricetulus griseus]XP_027252747.1 NIF3-like protein 1 isoform X3 [Cricetulus griseus]
MLYASKCRTELYINAISCVLTPDTVLPGFCMLSSAHLLPTSVRLAPSWICRSSRSFMDLKALLSSLNDFASLSFAESWDNVGLLVEPSPPHTVNTLFLTNDLTEEVMEEALQKKADLILSYHPPIFRAMKHITWKTWKERLVIRALENRVAIYSPHTAYDAAPQGVNNWLAKGLGTCSTRPIHPSRAPNYPTEGAHRLEFSVNHTQDLDKVMSAVKGIGDVSVTSFAARCDDEEQTRISLNCTQKALMQVLAFLSQNRQLYQKTEILSLEKNPQSKLWPCVLVLGAAFYKEWRLTFTSQVKCPTMMFWMLLPKE